jgi:hypothetical protein
MPDPNPKYIIPTAEFEPTAGERLTLFDQAGYQVVAAALRGDNGRNRLFQRCEGHPSIPGSPTGWHVIPKFLEIPLLQALLEELQANPKGQTVYAGTPREELVSAELRRSRAAKS